MTLLRFVSALFVLLGGMPAMAHEYWLLAEPGQRSAPGTTELSIKVGEYFEGDHLPFTRAYIARLRRYACGTEEDLLRRTPPAGDITQFEVPLRCAGTQVFALDSHPSAITLSADKFRAYLHDEGLDDIIKRREEQGTSATPGRERFRRHVKALVRTGEEGRTSATLQTGQRLEIVPVRDSAPQAAGGSMSVQLLFDGKPLVNRLVKAWYQHDGQTLTIRSLSSAAGTVTFHLPYAGLWMFSVVHMIPAEDTTDADWDSFWGNLTFHSRVGRKLPELPRLK